MTPATAATKQSRIRKATQEKHLSVANRSKFGRISIAFIKKHQSNHNFILDIFAQSFRQGGECIVELFLIHRIARWGVNSAPSRKHALDPAWFSHSSQPEEFTKSILSVKICKNKVSAATAANVCVGDNPVKLRHNVWDVVLIAALYFNMFVILTQIWNPP